VAIWLAGREEERESERTIAGKNRPCRSRGVVWKKAGAQGTALSDGSDLVKRGRRRRRRRRECACLCASPVFFERRRRARAGSRSRPHARDQGPGRPSHSVRIAARRKTGIRDREHPSPFKVEMEHSLVPPDDGKVRDDGDQVCDEGARGMMTRHRSEQMVIEIENEMDASRECRSSARCSFCRGLCTRTFTHMNGRW